MSKREEKESMEQLGEGRTAKIFEHSYERILKLYHSGIPEDVIKYEYEISKFISSVGIPAPEAYEMIEFEKKSGIIFQRIKGSSLLQLIVQNPLELNHFSKMLADLHFQIHKHEIKAKSFGRMQIRNQKEVLTQSIHDASQLSNEEKKTIIRYLEKLPNGTRLCHGDFHPDNVMIGEQKWIIDWLTGTIGNPAGDVARTLLLFRFGTLPDSTPRDVKEALRLMRDKIRKEYIKYYLSYSDLSLDEIDQWVLPIAAARLTEWIPSEEKEMLISLIKERLKQVLRDS